MAVKGSLSFYGDTYSVDSVELQNTETRAVTYVPESHPGGLNRSAEQETEIEQKGSQESPEGAGRRGRKIVFRVPPFSKGLGLSLSLILFAGLLAAGFKKLVAPKQPVPPEDVALVIGEAEGEVKEEPVEGASELEDVPTAEVVARLEKIRFMFPVAERLALAVSSPESAALLEAVREAVEEAHETALQGKGSGALEGSLTKALEALQALHQAAIKRASAIVHADEQIPKFPELDGMDENITGLLDDLAQIPRYRTVPLWVKTHQSLRENAARLTKQFDEAAKRASSGRQFKDEGDHEVLLATAVCLESLKYGSESRKRVTAAAKDMIEGVVSGIKCMLIKKRSGDLRSLTGNLTALKLYAALLKDSVADIHSEGSSEETEARLKEIEEGIKRASSLMDKALISIGVMRTETTLKAISVAGAKAAQLSHDAYAVIQKCGNIAALFPEPMNQLNAAGKKLIQDVASESFQMLVLGNTALLDILKDTRERGAMLYQAIPRKLMRYRNDAIADAQLDMASKLLNKSTKRLRDAQYSVTLAKRAASVDLAMQELSNINDLLVLDEMDKEAAELLRLNTHLLAFLEEDMESSAAEFERASSRSPHLLDTQWRKFEELQKDFNAARRSAEEATTLPEATQAASDMRSAAVALRDLLLAS